MKKVLVFGTFDGLHDGHLDFFRQALRYAQSKLAPQGKLQNIEKPYLIVVVGRDSTVQRTKNRLPKFNENERLKAVQECEFVNEARLGNEGNNPYKVIEEIKPDIICLGYDQTHFTEKLAEKIKGMGLSIKIERLNAFEPEKYHSSIINKNNI